MIKKLFSICIAINMYGCASVGSLDKAHDTNQDKNLYASVEVSDNVINIESLSTYRRIGRDYINLKDGTPDFGYEGQRDCSTGVWETKGCPVESFENVGQTLSDVAVNVFRNVITMGLSVLSGEMERTKTFDWDEYGRSYAEALKRKGIDKETIPKLADAVTELESIDKSRLQICSEAEEMKKSYEARYLSRYEADFKNSVKISDHSGLTFKYPFMNRSEILSFEINLPEFESNTCKQNRFKEVNIADLKSYEEIANEINMKRLNLEEGLNQALVDKSAYENLLGLGGTFKVRCKGSGGDIHNGFNYVTECKETLKFNESGLIEKPSSLTKVLSRDFNDVFPDSYKANDSTLTISLTGPTVKLTNNSSQYVSIKSLSLFYRDKISTIGDGETTIVELPPNAYKRYSINEFDLSSIPNDFADITQGLAQKTIVEFGISAKYSVTGLSQNMSLHNPKKYSLAYMLGL